jgi:hypothetical protein
MDSELKMLNKYLKKMFPFIVEVDNIFVLKKDMIYDPNTFTPVSNELLQFNTYVSPLHFCELMDDRVEKKLQALMIKQCGSLIKSIITDCNPDKVRFVFYPDLDKITIFDDIPKE